MIKSAILRLRNTSAKMAISYECPCGRLQRRILYPITNFAQINVESVHVQVEIGSSKVIQIPVVERQCVSHCQIA